MEIIIQSPQVLSLDLLYGRLILLLVPGVGSVSVQVCAHGAAAPLSAGGSRTALVLETLVPWSCWMWSETRCMCGAFPYFPQAPVSFLINHIFHASIHPSTLYSHLSCAGSRGIGALGEERGTPWTGCQSFTELTHRHKGTLLHSHLWTISSSPIHWAVWGNRAPHGSLCRKTPVRHEPRTFLL